MHLQHSIRMPKEEAVYLYWFTKSNAADVYMVLGILSAGLIWAGLKTETLFPLLTITHSSKNKKSENAAITSHGTLPSLHYF